MSTDIMMYAEIEIDGTWQILREPPHDLDPIDSNTRQPDLSPVYYDRQNYELFAILADERNPTGRTVDNRLFEIVAAPRGLPEDLSPELGDALSGEKIAGWLLLAEVLEFDWYGKVMQYEAMVDARVAHLFEESKPFPPADLWPKDIPIGYAVWDCDGVTVRWTDTYAAAAEDFMDFLEKLRQLGELSKIRLVFRFW
jgi:hypothetical protein